MRILVVSDTHGDMHTLLKAVNAQPKAEIIVHCGDGDAQVQMLKQLYKDKMIVGVKGNCDWSSWLPATETLKVLGKKIFITHGHLYNAKAGYYQLECAGREQNADIILFGHTHMPMTEYVNGIYMLNPGSCHGYMASYGYVDITENGDIVTNTVSIK